MRSLEHLEQYRIKHPIYNILGDDHNGAFVIPYKGYLFRIIASNGAGWDHVSVSTEKKTPVWDHMCYIKDLFFHDHETVIQFHPKKSEYINNHPHCLHLWRNQSHEHELPDSFLVGI